MKILPYSFYSRDTIIVARGLLGTILVRRCSGHAIAGKIVEVEAYCGTDDPASHAYRGVTSRNKVMFGKPGFSYVYFIYGNHNCLNVTTEKEGIPGAVLIRALEIVKGETLALKNRKGNSLKNLANGPGKLTQALNITREQNGLDLTKQDDIFILSKPITSNIEIVKTPRIGITQGREKLWRFYIKNNPHISKQ